MLPGYRIKISSDSVNERCISLTAINVLDLVEYFTKTLSSEWVKDTKVENFGVKALIDLGVSTQFFLESGIRQFNLVICQCIPYGNSANDC